MRFWSRILLLNLLMGASSAGALEMTATVDNDRPRQGQQIVLQVVITGSIRNPGEPKLPKLEPDFRVFSSGSSRNISIVNTKMTSSLTYTYVLIPQKQGRLRIGPVILERKNEVLRTDPITINVSAAGQPSAESNPGNAVGNDEMFVRGLLDKKRLYVGEQATLKLQLYTRVQLLETPSFGVPDMDGFWRESLPGTQPRIVTVSGQRYRLLEVALAIFPTRSGSLSIGTAEIIATVRRKRSGRDPRSVFGSIFDGKRLTLQTKPITVEVLPLPPEIPLGFNGAVGDYVLSVEAEPKEVGQGDPIQLVMTLSGKGNLESVPEIPLPDMPGYRVYPESPQVTTQVKGKTVTGTLTQKVLLVALTAGEQTIPAIRIPTFSPRTKSYKTLETKPILVTVHPGMVGEGVTGTSRQNIEVIGSDIRFIETDTPSFRTLGGESRYLAGLLLLPIPVALYGGVWWIDRRRRRLESNVALKRKSQGAKTARKRLNKLERRPSEDISGEAVSVFLNYLGDRWNLLGTALTQEIIAARLQKEGFETGPLMDFLEACDATRFAPGERGEEGGRVIEEVKTWILRLEQGS